MEEKNTSDRNHHAYAGNENTKKKENQDKKEDSNAPDQPLADVNDESKAKD